MLTAFQWFSFVCIFAAALAGGFMPIFRRERARSVAGFPLGQAFAAGAKSRTMPVIMTLMIAVPSQMVKVGNWSRL